MMALKSAINGANCYRHAGEVLDSAVTADYAKETHSIGGAGRFR
jgi:hypothetical protein